MIKQCLSIALLAMPPLAAADESRYFAMSFEDLLKVTIETVSRSEESLRNTPAQVLVISGEELRSRGYRELSEALDDLPGMDVGRVWGDKYMSVVWRGFRQTLGTPFLLLVDGQRMNQLYYADAEVMAALPTPKSRMDWPVPRLMPSIRWHRTSSRLAWNTGVTNIA